MGLGLVWTMQTAKNDTTSNNTNKTYSNSQEVVQKTQSQGSNSQSQVSNTPKTNTQTEAQSEYVTLTCEVCGKQFQSPRNGPQLRICDQCVNTPEAQNLLQEAGY